MLRTKIYYDAKADNLLLGRKLYRVLRRIGEKGSRPKNIAVFENIIELNDFRNRKRLPLYKNTDLLTQEMHYSYIDFLKKKYY